MNKISSELPIRFQKFFTSMAAVSLLAYCGGVVFQYFHGLQLGYGNHSAWEGVSTILRVALPLALFTIGVRVGRGGWWHRFMVGALCANGALLSQFLLMMTIGIVSSVITLDYSIFDSLLSLVVIISWATVLWLFRTRANLWRRRHIAYVLGVIGASLAYTIFGVVSTIGSAAGSSWQEWSAMLIANLVVLLLMLVAYFLLSGVSWSQRLFRVVLVMMAAFMTTTIISDIVSIVIQTQFAAGTDIFNGSAYLIAWIGLPILVYGIALWLVRPAARRRPTGKLAGVKI